VTTANHRYSTLDQINKDNVEGPAGRMDLLDRGSSRSRRFAAGDRRHDVCTHAVPEQRVRARPVQRARQIVWKYEPKQDPNVIPVMCCDTVNRGVAYADGMIFLHQADTKVVALDAKTGEEKWSAVNGDPSKGETNTATVLPVKDKVIVGISGGEFGVRGHVTAYNIKDGSMAWRAYSMGPDSDTLIDPEKTTHLGQPVGKDSGTNTWEGDQWKIGGGTTWGWYLL
jgi:glucose dehydrogenase